MEVAGRDLAGACSTGHSAVLQVAKKIPRISESGFSFNLELGDPC